MLKQITAVISDTKTNIRNIEARTGNGQANVDIVLDIADLKHLEKIITGVRKIPGVHEVQRLQKISSSVIGGQSSTRTNWELITGN